MKLIFLFLATISILGVSCERHEFEGPNGTKQLHKPHGGGHGAEDHHGEEHASDKKDAHKAEH